jgi:hypothetical protein
MTVRFRINDPDLKCQNGIPGSNLHRRSGRGRPGANRYENKTIGGTGLHLVRSLVQGGAVLRWAILGGFGSYGSEASPFHLP